MLFCQGHSRQEKDEGKNPQQKKPNKPKKPQTTSKPVHPGRDVPHKHQNADGVSADKKAALKCICSTYQGWESQGRKAPHLNT